MSDPDLISRYNYDSFVPDNFMQWMNFESSPPLGQPAPEFPLWHLDGTETTLGEVWRRHAYTIVEFGSFT